MYVTALYEVLAKNKKNGDSDGSELDNQVFLLCEIQWRDHNRLIS